MPRNASLKLILNLEPLNAVLSGVGVYIKQIVPHVIGSEAVEDIAFFCGHRRISWADAHSLLNGEAMRNSGNLRRKIARLLDKCLPHLLWSVSRALFWWRTRKLADYVYLELNNVSRPFRGRTVTLVHDLSHVHFPECHPARRISYFRRYFDAGLNRSSRVVTVSDAIAREIRDRYGFGDRISVVAPACSGLFRRRSPGETEAVRRKYRLPERFILTVGSMEPRKNLDGLISAFKLLPDWARKDSSLVVVGPQGWNNEPVRQRLEALRCSGEAILPGYVAEADLPSFYSLATMFVYISRYEGFGMPVVEAMACGTPTIVSEDAGLREAASGASLCVEHGDVEGLRDAILRLAGDSDLRACLGRRGMQRSARLSWETSARRLLTCVQQAAQ